MEVISLMKLQTTNIMIVFRIILIVTTSADILMRPQVSAMMKTALILGFIGLHLNDYIRNSVQFFERNRIPYVVSMIISIVGIGLYLFRFDTVPLNIYFIFPVVEIFLFHSRIQMGLLIFHVIVYIIGMFLLHEPVQKALLPYFALIATIYLFRSISKEKEKGNLLHAELIEANAKLKEITIVKERTRIAQELHDSIGHALIALKMHLEFAENTIDTNPDKSKEVIKKALGISQTSITDLRKAVDVLKDTGSWEKKIKLRDALVDLIQGLETTGRLEFDYFLDDKTDDASDTIQTVVYETVREAITNGIKHGHAQAFHIEIFVHERKLFVKIEDDGAGSGGIVKSHGLRGMEERIHALNGKIQFVTEKDQGFAVEAEIPYME